MVLTVLPSGPPSMGSYLGLWFLYSAVVGLLAAYVAGRALPVGAPYLHVFRFVGATAFIGYSVALADVDLVPSRLEHDDQGDGGRVDLRAPDRGHVRLAVAALGSPAS